MKVWILQTGEPLHIDKGNPRPMRAMNLSNKLVEAGHSVVLWSSAFSHQGKKHRTKKYEIHKVNENLEIRLIPSCGYKKHIGLARLFDHFQLAINLKKLLKKEIDTPDIAFIGYPPIETAAVMSKWLKTKNVPMMLDVKDLWPSMFVEAFPKAIQPIAKIIFYPYFYLAKRTIRDVQGLSAMAPAFLDWVLNFANKEKTNNDIVFRLTSPSGEVSKEELLLANEWWDTQGIDRNKPIVFFAGSFMSVFDFNPIAKVAKKLKNCQFVLCGEGDYLVEVKNKIKGCDNVFFPGWVDRPKIESLAKISMASLAPYKSIDNYMVNTPNKIVDALSLGLPILSPLQGEVKKLIDTHIVGLTYKDGSSLSYCIQQLIEDKKLQQQLSNNAKKLYEKEFEFNKVYNNFIKHLKGFLSLKRKVLKVWILQTGEPLHIDKGNPRPMRAMNLSNKLVEAGYSVVLWSSAFSHQGKKHRTKKYEIHKVNGNLEIRLIPSCGYKKHIGLARLFDHFQLARNLKKILKKEIDTPDIAFIGYPPIETAAVMSKWLKTKNVPMMLDVKDLWPSMFVEAFPKAIQSIAKVVFYPYFYLAKRTIREVQGVSAMAPAFLDWVLNFANKKKSNNDVVFRLTSPTGEVENKELLLANEWWDTQGIDRNKPIVFFVGSFMSVFDFNPIAKVAKELKNCQFVLCGEGDYLVEVKKKMKGCDNVFFPGWVDRPKIESLAKMSIAALIPYKNIEAFMLSVPNKVVDALSLRLPILSSLDGEVGEIINNSIGFYYYDGESLKKAIKIVIDDKERQQKMSDNAKKLYEKEFEFNKVYNNFVQHLECLYREKKC